MEITPGRAPFTEDEDYVPLRKPKSATNTPTHGPTYNNVAFAAGASAGYNNAAALVPSENYARTLSPTKLSPFAKEFVPRPGTGGGGGGSGSGSVASGSNLSEHFEQQQRQQQQQFDHQNYQQYHQSRQRYSNGYQQHHQQQQQQQHHNNHHNHNQQHQQQQQQMYATQVASLTTSVQERLRVGSGNVSSDIGGAVNITNSINNHYQQQQQQQHRNNTHYNHHHHQQQQQSHHHHHQQQQQHHHHNNQNHHNHQNHHHHNQQHQRYNHHQQQQQQQHPHSSSSNTSHNQQMASAEVETIALDYLQTVIQCLNQNPGQFDTIATRFLTIFDGMEHNQYVLSNAMEDIFNESIQNPNFRYMGAKLYNLLHMLNLKKDSLFHTLLKCKLEYHQQEVLQYMQNNQQQKVRETALFLAELYMQLRGDDSRIHLIAENIVYSLKQLLSKESTDNVRCICLTLKLAGYDLTVDCAADMHEIITQLDGINQRNPGKYPLAANVISLQKNNWGRKVSSPSSDQEFAKPPEPLRTSDEPIFYGPDGRELTAEETDFLAGGAAAGSGSTDDDDEMGDLDVDFDPEMDEETEKAYKEFCKLKTDAAAPATSK